MQTKLLTIPNLLTVLNLVCGAWGAVAALVYGNLTLAFCLMVAGAVFDFFDGFVARRLRQEGRLGIELDSQADNVTFGFLPAAILFVLFGQMPGWTAMPDRVGFLLFFYAGFVALRLAKFNIDDTQHEEFRGLPSPGAALLCASLGLLSERCGLVLSREIILLVALVVGLLMVSSVRMFSFKFAGFGWQGNRLRYAFLLLSVVLLAVLRLWAVPVIIVLYILVSAGRRFVCSKSCKE